MRPRRPLPSLKRMLAEYLAMVLVYIAAFQLATFFGRSSTEAVIWAMVSMLVTLMIARNTRPKGNAPPGNTPPPGV